MSTERRPTAFPRFGGVRLDLPSDEVSANEAIYAINSDFDAGTPAGMRRRDAATTLKETASAAYSGLYAHNNERLLAYSGGVGKILAYDGIGTKKAEIAWAGSGFLSFARFGTPSAAYTYAMSSGAKPIRYDGTSFAEPTATVDGVAAKAMPQGRRIAVWADGGNRLVVAGTAAGGFGPNGATSTPSHVWFSEPGNAEAYESTAYVQLTPNDGEAIVGCCVWQGQVFVFKQTKLFVFWGVNVDEEGRPVFNYRSVDLPTPLVAQTGFNGNSSQPCVPAGNGVYFLATGGVYLTNGGPPVCVSEQLAPLAFSNLPIFGKLTSEGEKQAEEEGGEGPSPYPVSLTEQPWRNYFGLAYSNGRLYVWGNSQILWVYDERAVAWLPWTTPPASMTPFNDVNDEITRLFFTSGNRIGRFPPETRGKDFGATTFTHIWQSGFYDLGSEDEKTLVEAKLWGTGTITFSSHRDLSARADFTDEVAISGTGQGRSHSTQTATLFSHRISLADGAKLQRLVRYLRETRVATTKTPR